MNRTAPTLRITSRLTALALAALACLATLQWIDSMASAGHGDTLMARAAGQAAATATALRQGSPRG